MYTTSSQGSIVFIAIALLLILSMAVFISFIVYRYQKYQNNYYKELENLKSIHRNEILQSQIEIQEQTFQNISREIHDNIGQKLSLAKLRLNTIDTDEPKSIRENLDLAVNMIGESINDLSDISRSMSSEMILNNGLIRALEFETEQLQKSGKYKIGLSVNGESVFMDAKKELVLFRIVQEALNNIMKHSDASSISIHMDFSEAVLLLEIRDNGKGFRSDAHDFRGNGLMNMKKRALALNGRFSINSTPGQGTTIQLNIPMHEPET